MEAFVISFAVISILVFLGTLGLFFQAIDYLNRALELHQQNQLTIIQIRESIANEHNAIKNWVDEVGAELAGVQSEVQEVKDFCVKSFTDLESTFQDIGLRIQKQEQALSGLKPDLKIPSNKLN